MSVPVAPPDSVEDQALAASLGDLDALADLFERFQDPLVRYLRCRTQNNLTLAEEISAATWERVVAGIRDYRRKGAGFEAWLFTIARRCLAAHYRFFQRHPERLQGEMLAYDQVDGGSPDDQLERKFQAHQIAVATNSLPSAQRECVILRFYSGLTLAETAEAMGKNTNTIKQLQFRALRSLEKSLRIDGATESFQTHATLGGHVDAGQIPTGGSA